MWWMGRLCIGVKRCAVVLCAALCVNWWNYVAMVNSYDFSPE